VHALGGEKAPPRAKQRYRYKGEEREMGLFVSKRVLGNLNGAVKNSYCGKNHGRHRGNKGRWTVFQK